MKCHDLRTIKSPPSNMATLLGLGPKCCIQDKKIDMQTLVTTIKRFKCDVRVNHYAITEHGFENKPGPMLHFKSTSNKIPRAPNAIEGALKRFEIALRTAALNRKIHNTTNITKLQENILKYFQNHLECVILQTDKNLGPCAMNRKNYIEQRIAKHLSNEKYYEIIDESTAQEYMNKSMNEFLNYVKKT